MIDCKPIDTLLVPNQKYNANMDLGYVDASRYWHLVGNFNYLAVMRLDISHTRGINRQCYWNAAAQGTSIY